MSDQKLIEKQSRSAPARRIIGAASDREHAAIVFSFPSSPAQTLGLAPSSPQEWMPPVETFGVECVKEVDARVSMVLDQMIKALSGVLPVIAIIAEPIEDHQALHITVFADTLTDDVRDAIYSAELAIIDEHKDMAFDFHVRQADRVDGQPVVPPAPYALVLWHRTEANAEQG